MSKEIIEIKDFGLMIDSLKPIAKVSSGAKIVVNEFGARISTRNERARVEMKTNSFCSKTTSTMIIGDMGNFIKILNSVNSIHEGDASGVSFFIDGNCVKIESKRFKTKFSMDSEDKIAQSVDEGFKSDLSAIGSDYEFITNSSFIKRLGTHGFMFSDMHSIRVYIKSEKDMNGNTIYATIGDESNEFENSVTFEFGFLTSGSVGDDRIILDFESLEMLNLVQSEEIKIKKPSGKNSIIAFVEKKGTGGTYMNLTVAGRILVK